MIYRFVSIKEVLAQFYRNTSPGTEVSFSDVVEWSAEALDLIGAQPQFENKIQDIEIDKFFGEIPCDLVGLYQISRDDGTAMNLYSGTLASIPSDGSTTYNDVFIPDYNTMDETLRFIPINGDTFPQSGYNDMANPKQAFYYLSGDKIYTSFKTGTVRMSYLAIRLDCDGYPMIPDLQEYKQAVIAYVQYMLDWQAWRAQRLPEAVYRDSEQKWFRFERRARGKAKLPNIAQLESIKNMSVRLLPDINKFKYFFNTLNTQEKLWKI